MNEQIESFLQKSIFPELERGRPNFDKPHTTGVVHHIKEIIKQNPERNLDEDVLIISAYAHDWGYSNLFNDGRPIDLDRVKEEKPLHAKLSAEKVTKLLDNPIFEYLSPERKARIAHLVAMHDRLDELKDTDELILMEADTLGGLDVTFITPTFDKDSNERIMNGFRKRRQPLLITDYAKTMFEKVFQSRVDFYTKDFNQIQYQNNFQTYVEHNKSFEVGGGSPEDRANLILKYLPKGRTIFEIGSGVGADALALKDAGYEVIASDFVQKFIDELKSRQLNAIYFDAKKDDIPEGVDCVYANAVFVHLSPEEVFSFLTRARNKLQNERLIFISIIKGKGYERSARAKGFERDFYYYQLDSMNKLLTEVGYKVIFSNDSDPKWLQIIGKVV